MPLDPNAQQSINDQNVYIRDTLMSIAAKYSETLKDAVESAFDSVDATVLQNVGKDLTRSFTKLAKMSDEFALNQSRIKKGLLSQKDIEKQITSLQEKREALAVKMAHANELNADFSNDDYQNALKSLKVQEEQLENDKKLAKSVSFRIGLQKGLNGIQDKFNINQIKDTLTIAGLFKILIEGAFRFNKISVEIGKNLGYGADNANRVASNMVSVAQSSRNFNITLQNIANAANELSTATGFVAEYSADTLETQIMLTKQFGLTGEEAAGIYKLSVLTGKSSKEVNDNMVKAFVATRNSLKVGVPFKATIAEAAKLSGRLAANLQNDPAGIVKAVVATKALGTSLEQTAKQGEALLNFESSIESELKAELITGKQLNLERARAAALVGDQVTLAQELVSQVGSLDDFQKMNVIQQKSIAEAVGLTADELADQLKKQELAIESGKSLAQLTEEEAIEAQKRQDIQEKFNNTVLKLQDALGNILAGPLAGLIEGFANILSSAAGLYSILGLIATVSLVKMISGLTTALALKKLATRESVKGATADIAGASAKAGGSAASIPGIGWLIAGGVAAALFGALMGYLAGAKTGDDVISPGYGKRMMFGPEGAIAFNNKDTIVAGTDLDDRGGGGGSFDLTPMISAINEVRAAVDRLYNKDTSINMDSKKVGSTLVQGSYKLA